MAVSFKTSDGYGVAILKLFVSDTLVEAAKALGLVVDQVSPGAFMVMLKDGTPIGSVSIKGSALSLAKSGLLGGLSKQAIGGQFEALIKKAWDLYHPDIPAKEPKPPVDAPMLMTSPGKSDSSPVELGKATKIYQPVLGSSTGSVYYVIALWVDFQLAVRFKSGVLSARVAGVGLPNIKGTLVAQGFKHVAGSGANYASIHLSVSDSTMAAKVVGSIVGLLGFSGLKQAGEVHVVEGK